MRLVLLASVLLVVACTSTSSQLRTRFARERTCPEDVVHVTQSGATGYTVTGCGYMTEYVCPSFATNTSDARACEEAGSPGKKPGADLAPVPMATAPGNAPGPVSK